VRQQATDQSDKAGGEEGAQKYQCASRGLSRLQRKVPFSGTDGTQARAPDIDMSKCP